MRRSFLLSLVAMVLLPAGLEADSCRCMALDRTIDAYRPDVIFRGRVVGTSLRVVPRPPYLGRSQVTVGFEVDRVWVGTVEERTTIVVGVPMNCGFEPFLGLSFIVPVYVNEWGELETGTCLGVQSAYAAGELLEILGKGYDPAPLACDCGPVPLGPEYDLYERLLFWYSVLSALGLAGICAWFGGDLVRRCRI